MSIHFRKAKCVSEIAIGVRSHGADHKEPAAPEDPRMKYLDVFISSFNLVAEQDIRAALAPHASPNVMLVSTWMSHNMPYAQKRCREVNGIVPISRLISQFTKATPDFVLDVKEKVLYKLHDGTSFLVAKTVATGSFFLTLYLRNALTSSLLPPFIASRIFSRNSFFPRLFRLTTRMEDDTCGTEASSPKTSGSDSDNNNVRICDDDARLDEVLLDNPEDISDQFFLPPIGLLDRPTESLLQKRKPKRKQRISMVHRNLFKVRQQQILADQVEIATEDTKIDVLRATRPSSYVVSAVLVFHIDVDHMVYKLECFKRLERKALF